MTLSSSIHTLNDLESCFEFLRQYDTKHVSTTSIGTQLRPRYREKDSGDAE